MENKQEHLENIWLSNSFSSLQHFAQKQKAVEHSPQSFASFKWLSGNPCVSDTWKNACKDLILVRYECKISGTAVNEKMKSMRCRPKLLNEAELSNKETYAASGENVRGREGYKDRDCLLYLWQSATVKPPVNPASVMAREPKGTSFIWSFILAASAAKLLLKVTYFPHW